MTTLADLPLGAVFSFGAVVTSAGAFDLMSKDNAVQAHVTIDPDTLALTGTLTQAPNLIPVEVVAAPFAVGDIVADENGSAFVVRDAWLGESGFCWSNSPSRGAVYTTAGFMKIGTATIGTT